MRFITSSFLLLSAALIASAGPLSGRSEAICPGQKVESEWFIGEEKTVKAQSVSCPPESFQVVKRSSLEARDTNVCGAPCTTHCFTPSGGGPDPNDCHIIADALRFDSQNIGPIFAVANGTNNVLSLTFATCTTFFVNQAPTSTLDYCRTDFAAVADFVAPNCQATQNAHGGLCLANDQQWFVQVNHS
ncbi:hypothetical protein C8J56DRAFT_30803 [Mycena floridula]|nr:hypothetical protein C8J56DRAFT_30803 [Mycena floridula]